MIPNTSTMTLRINGDKTDNTMKRADRFAGAQELIDALESLGTEPHAALTDEKILAAKERESTFLFPLRRSRRSSFGAVAAIAFVK